MKVKIPYGKDNLEVNISEENLLEILYPNSVEKTNSTKQIKEVLNKEKFNEFIDSNEKIVIIVNDGTRPTPTIKVLKEIFPKLRSKNFQFIIATGAHRAPNDEEYEFIFGKDIYGELKGTDKIWAHDSKKDEMIYLGESKNGTPMYINEIVAKAKKVIVIGSVEPHYFAGYTGGRKGFLPGVASYETITENHKLALNSTAKALSLKGNPVHEDMMDAMKVLKDIDIFSIMTVLDREHDIYALTAGDLEKSFYNAIDKANEVFCVEIKEKADIVISAAPYPMDIDLYQSQKAIDNGKLALKENGILIFVSQCRMGIGGKTFFDLMASCGTPKEVLDKIKKDYKLGYHKAGKMAEINMWAETWGVTELPEKEIKAVHIKPFKNLDEAIEKALEKKGKDSKILVMPYGSLTVPLLSE
ncbi:nickel-dependent lactate racemase [Haliovirga abyssi]|uniref:Transcriptional regulator n=1 Tax=Haliovirga abyssi TaxID=2996794 RepID=A0AAU9DZ74_9FUSO|nr:nickel-dependent lactate racemase [Haliovirga abyssi]BDU50810.1 transcriptional regulator [Haliovirga abyssi]